MRRAESINLAFLLFLMGLTWLRPLPLRRRARVLAIGAAGVALIWGAHFAGRFLSPLAASVIRDWLPSPLLLLVSWQARQYSCEYLSQRSRSRIGGRRSGAVPRGAMGGSTVFVGCRVDRLRGSDRALSLCGRRPSGRCTGRERFPAGATRG